MLQKFRTLPRPKSTQDLRLNKISCRRSLLCFYGLNATLVHGWENIKKSNRYSILGLSTLLECKVVPDYDYDKQSMGEKPKDPWLDRS